MYLMVDDFPRAISSAIRGMREPLRVCHGDENEREGRFCNKYQPSVLKWQKEIKRLLIAHYSGERPRLRPRSI